MRPSAAVSGLLFIVATLVGVGIGFAALAHDPQHNGALAALGAGGGVAVGIYLGSAVKVVAQWERMVVLRLGRFRSVADPGMTFILPVLDTPIFVDTRVQTIAIAQQQAITQDNVPVKVSGVVFFKVADAEAAALRVQDYRAAIFRLAQATIRDVIGRLSLDELLSHQKRLEEEVRQSVDVSSNAWGLHVEQIKLEDIDVPEELKKMMARQASSEREKRATIIKADGDRQAASALAEAAATMAASPGAMQLRVLQTLDGLGPSASNTVVFAVPMDIYEAIRTYASHRNGAA